MDYLLEVIVLLLWELTLPLYFEAFLFLRLETFTGFWDFFSKSFWGFYRIMVYLYIVAECDGWSLLASALAQTWLDFNIVTISIELLVSFETSDDVFAIAFAAASACTDLHGYEWHGE